MQPVYFASICAVINYDLKLNHNFFIAFGNTKKKRDIKIPAKL